MIDIRLLEKTEGDRDISFPRRLIEFAENQKENPEIAFDKERDKMIVVFDGDIFEEKVLDYDELVAEGEKNNILAVSNPAFELFLLLHYENSYEDDIEPNAEQIIQNEKDGHQTFIYKLLLARTGINPKKNSSIGELAKNIEIAIEQEKKINEDIHQCKGQITCNIGRIIDEIRKDDGLISFSDTWLDIAMLEEYSLENNDSDKILGNDYLGLFSRKNSNKRKEYITSELIYWVQVSYYNYRNEETYENIWLGRASNRSKRTSGNNILFLQPSLEERYYDGNNTRSEAVIDSLNLSGEETAKQCEEYAEELFEKWDF